MASALAAPTLDPSLMASAQSAYGGPTGGARAGVAATGAGAASLNPKQQARVHAAAQDFEAVFVSSMLENMWAEVKTSASFGGGNAEKMYRSMMNQEYGKAIARNGGLGLAPAIEAQMIRLQEVADHK